MRKFSPAMEDGEGNSGESTSIDVAADLLDSSDVFHIVIDVVGFILFMHQQIPSVIQEISQEFGELQAEFKELEGDLAKSEMKGVSISTRKKQAARKREVKMGVRRWEKLVNSISNLKASLLLLISEVPNVEIICLVLGPSSLRPLHVYELSLPYGRPISGDSSRSKLAENLSKKVIRAMISGCAGSDSCAGPTKLFLLVKAPSELNLPLHFLPKREFHRNRKIVPFRLRFTCREGETNSDSASPVLQQNSTSTDFIWFQCRHTIKGLSFTRSPPDDR